MPLDLLESLAQYWEGIIGTSALVISILSLLRDKHSRQMDMLHDVFQNIRDLNIEISNLTESGKSKEQIRQDATIVKMEKIKEFDYLCYLVNRKLAREKEVYDLGGEDIIDLYDRYEDEIKEGRYYDIGRVVNRWKSHPPTSIKNRLILWCEKTKYNLFH